MPVKTLSVALLGAGEPLAEAIRRLIEDREIEIGRLVPLALEESDACMDFRGESIPISAAAGFAWGSVDVVLNASHLPGATALLAEAGAAGCSVLHCELAGADLPIALPNGVAIALSRLVSRIARKTPIAGVQASVNLPVSHLGQAGIDELSQQTRALFAMESPDAECLPPRIAFNLVPQVPESRIEARSRFERATEDALIRELTLADLPIQVMALWAPVFYGYSAVLHLSLSEPLDPESLRKSLRQAEDVTLMDEAAPGGAPTPATDAQDSDAVFVGRVRVQAGDARRLSLWLVFDGLRLEAVRIVTELENLIEKTRKSVLT